MKVDINYIKWSWNRDAGEHNQWNSLSDDEKVEFAVNLVKKEASQALDDLMVAIFMPHKSSISIEHAVGHLRQDLEL